MQSYSFDNMRKDANGYYDLMQKTVINQYHLDLIPYTITPEYEMRLYKLCDEVYGTTGLIEEIMTVNGLLNMWSIKTGDVIFLFQLKDLTLIQGTEPEKVDKTQLSNPEKNTVNDPNRLPPSINPGFKQVTLDTKAKKIKILDRLS